MTRQTKLVKDKLTGANLAGGDFHDTDLSQAKLGHATLKGTNLAGADLSGADLHHDNLETANLRGARLAGADLHEADLMGADLTRAQLHGANLADAKVRGADLTDADLSDAILDGVNLEEARSLAGTRLPTPPKQARTEPASSTKRTQRAKGNERSSSSAEPAIDADTTHHSDPSAIESGLRQAVPSGSSSASDAESN